MLVLTRKLMEKVYIGDEICVTVVRLDNGQVRLGIDAPRQVPVVRAELRSRDGDAGKGRIITAGEAAPPAHPVPLAIGLRRRGLAH
jgi:carbon storage regulator